MKVSIIFIFIFFFKTNFLLAQNTVSFPEKLDPQGFRDVFVQVDSVYISGQPEEKSFKRLKDMGVTTVINLRTDREMNNRDYVPFDEKKALENLGLDYIHIPLGGSDFPYTKEALNTFARSLEEADGKVLLHCTVAWRASHMWAAYLIEYKGFKPDKAIEHAKAINFGTIPLEGLLGKKLIFEFK